MDYRGGDLDLRTPKARAGGADSDRFEYAAGAGDYAFANGAARAQPPIYVDDTLMACCNHAYDVAVAHRSAEVRIEHLLYALTRIDAAAEVLEAAGIRDAGLRRDGAAVIASEIPIGPTNGTTKPRRSPAFEEALRLAAQQGYRRNRPASVSDLLHVFLEVKPDLQGLDLLRRHLPHSYREPDDFGLAVAPPRYQPEEPLSSYSQPMYRPALIEEPRLPRYEPQDAVDAVQNARLADLEAMVRALREELASERHTFAALLGDMKRDLTAQRSASHSLSSVLQDRLSSMEQIVVGAGGSADTSAVREVLSHTSERLARMERGVAARIEELNRQLAHVAGKIDQIEYTERNGGVDLGPLSRQIGHLTQKIDAIEARERPDGLELAHVTRQLNVVTEKLTALEQATGDGDLDIDIMPILARLEGVERALRERDSGQESPMLGAINDRLINVERLANYQPDVKVDLSAIENRLSDIETAVMSQDGQTHSRRFEERIDTLEQLVRQRFTEIGNQVSLLERSGGGTDPDLATALQSEIKALAGAVASGNATQERFVSAVQSEIQSLASRPIPNMPDLQPAISGLRDQLQSLSQFSQQIGQVAYAQQQTGEQLASLSRQQQETQAALVQRLENLEQRFQRSDEGFSAGRADFVRELGDVHEAIMKLNSNQHAISQSIDTWRGDTLGSVNTVSNRLYAFEQKLGGGSTEEISRLSQNLDRMYRVTVERYHRRNRFWFWLFGTDDWIGASWPSQASRVEQELQAFKDGRRISA